jgi:uncharacterized protein YjiS (DUF1127 family)
MNAQFAKPAESFALPGLTSEPRAHRPAGVGAKLLAAVRWFAELPRRQAVLEELSALSDRELADIGLNRGDLPRVFDPAFAKARYKAGRAGA